MLLAVTFFSLGLQSVSASAILITPIGTTITVASNETFILAFKMRFDETNWGYFSVTFWWDNNETAPEAEKWNFTYIGFVAKFTDGTPFSGPINVSIGKYGSDEYPGYYRYIVNIRETYGEPYGTSPPNDKEFWLNVTMRAAGVLNGTYIPHADGDQDITIFKVRCNEATMNELGSENCTIHVIGSKFPEFPTWTSILLILIVLAFTIAIYKRRPLKTPIH